VKATLTQAEMMTAVMVGTLRVVRKFKQGNIDKAGANLPRWQTDIEAAAAELAFAKAMNLYPLGISAGFVDDVAGGWQVRHTERDDGCLIVRNDDADGDRFVLVCGNYGSYRIVGWLYGYEAKNEKWSRSPGGRPAAYFVPEEALTAFGGDG
jgi:hypothetical protein